MEGGSSIMSKTYWCILHRCLCKEVIVLVKNVCKKKYGIMFCKDCKYCQEGEK